MNINEIRQKYPQYDDLSDEELADAFHKKYYADLPREEFLGKLGVQQQPQPAVKGPSIAEQLWAGFKDPFYAAGQIIGHGLPAGERLNKVIEEQEKDYQQRRTAAGETGVDWGRMAGNIVSPPNLATSAVAPFKILPQALAGAGMGLLTPTSKTGEGEFLEEKAKQAAIGAGVGAAVPAAVKTGKAFITPAVDATDALFTSLGLKSGDRLARKRLLEAIERDQTSPEELLRIVKQANEQGFPQSVIDVAGPNVRNLAERTIKRSGKDYVDIVKHHQERAREIPQRASEYLKQELVESNPDAATYLATKNSLDETLGEMDEYFSKNWATRQGELPPNINSKLAELAKGDPDFKEAYRRAREITAGRDDLDISKPEYGNALLYYTKKGLDSYADSIKKPGYNPEVANRIREKSDLVDRLLREVSGDYSAQMGFIDDLTKQRNALELGREVHKSGTTPEAIEEALKGMSKEERDNFLVGVRESSMRQLGKNQEPSSLTRTAFGSESSDVRSKMGSIYGPDMDTMLERLGIYDTMLGTSRNVPTLAHTNPISAVLDPEARDIGYLGTAAGQILPGIPFLSPGLRTLAASRTLPSRSAALTSKAVYGPLNNFESLIGKTGRPGLSQNLRFALPGLMPSGLRYEDIMDE